MELFLHTMEELLESITRLGIVVLEFMGIVIIIGCGIKGFYSYVRRLPDMKLTLAKGLAIALEFKLGSEILRTVIVREWSEIASVAGIIVLRAVLTFLLHWEIKEEGKQRE